MKSDAGKKLTKAQRAFLAKHDGSKPLSEHDGGYKPVRFVFRMDELGLLKADRRGRIFGYSSTTLTEAGRLALKENN